MDSCKKGRWHYFNRTLYMYGWVNWQIISVVLIYSHYIFQIDVVKYVLMSLQYCSKWRLVSAWGLLQRHAPRYHVYGINLFLHRYVFGFTCTFLINCIFQTLPSPVIQINFEKPSKRFRKEGETVSQSQRNTSDCNPRISETVLLQELHNVCPTAAVFTVKAGFPCQQLYMRGM